MPNEIIVRRKRPRPPEAVLSVFRGARSGFVVDARGRTGGLDHHIHPITKATGFSGVALTVLCRPWDNLAAHVALDLIEPGDVLMMTTGGFEQASVIGEKYVGIARNNGAVAIVVDGMARDVSRYDEIGIPVFARGVTPNSSFKDGPGAVGLPIAMGGFPVSSGDIVVGDADGLIVVPLDIAEETAARLTRITEKENAMFAAISREGTKPEAMAAISSMAQIRYVD